MEISLGIFVFFIVVAFLGLYIVIETAVRRGIDSSQTYELIKELVEHERKKNN